MKFSFKTIFANGLSGFSLATSAAGFE